jgi:predicted glycosyltransferase
MTRVVFLVNHLMGSGHLVRTLAVARAVQAAGASAVVLSGGRPLPHLGASGVPLVQLPWLSSNGMDYRTLLGPDGMPASAAYRDQRRAALAQAVRAAQPDVLVTELWPFGRRMLEADFLTAIDAAPAVPLVCSLRDIVEPPSRSERVAQTVAHVRRFARVLFHGDPAVLPLEASWPGDGLLPEAVRARLAPTGYVTTPPPVPIPCPGTVLVSVGSGMIGRPLLRLAAQAAALSPMRWHLLVGGADAAAEIAALRGLGPAVVEPVRADFRALLGGAAAAVCLGGYNTLLEALLSGTPTLVVPMAEGGEREQAIRAAAFARQPGLRTAALADLTPAGLAATAAALAASPRLADTALLTDGAAVSARLLLDAGQL